MARYRIDVLELARKETAPGTSRGLKYAVVIRGHEKEPMNENLAHALSEELKKSVRIRRPIDVESSKHSIPRYRVLQDIKKRVGSLQTVQLTRPEQRGSEDTGQQFPLGQMVEKVMQEEGQADRVAEEEEHQLSLHFDRFYRARERARTIAAYLRNRDHQVETSNTERAGDV